MVSKFDIVCSIFYHWNKIVTLLQIEASVKVARENLLSQIELYQKQGVKSSLEATEQSKPTTKAEVDPVPSIDLNELPVADTNSNVLPKQEL